MKIHTWTPADNDRQAYRGYESRASLLSPTTTPAWQRDVCIKTMTEAQRLRALDAASKALEQGERFFQRTLARGEAFGPALERLRIACAPLERETLEAEAAA